MASPSPSGISTRRRRSLSGFCATRASTARAAASSPSRRWARDRASDARGSPGTSARTRSRMGSAAAGCSFRTKAWPSAACATGSSGRATAALRACARATSERSRPRNARAASRFVGPSSGARHRTACACSAATPGLPQSRASRANARRRSLWSPTAKPRARSQVFQAWSWSEVRRWAATRASHASGDSGAIWQDFCKVATAWCPLPAASASRPALSNSAAWVWATASRVPPSGKAEACADRFSATVSACASAFPAGELVVAARDGKDCFCRGGTVPERTKRREMNQPASTTANAQSRMMSSLVCRGIPRYPISFLRGAVLCFFIAF